MDAEKASFDWNDIRGLPMLHNSIVHRGSDGGGGDDEDEEDEDSNGDWGGRDDDRRLRENRNSYMVDEDGAQYDADSLAWRYLGLYVDCDDGGGGGGSKDGGGGNDGQGQSSGSNSYCERKLLWAAYHDPRYRGNSIEEYQFYDVVSRTWDDATCSRDGMRYARRCARLDCHESSTGFELVGVFKENDGMYDWTEQLFKHEGMCVWNDDETYQTMEKWMNVWPTSCQELYVPDVWGNTLYMAVKPTGGGNMTLAIYKDSICSRASSMDLSTYLVKLYKSKGYDEQAGYSAAETWKGAISTWNEKMSYFKVCQPCVAYNRYSEQSKDNGRGGGGGRSLGNNDGNGNERSRYNCYDDAGYTNVNQCYKFETKTSLRVAYEEDLHAASNQGSILKIKAYGKVYGKGGYATPMSSAVKTAYESLAVLSIAGLVLSVLYIRRCFQRFTHGRRRIMPTSLMDVIIGGEYKDRAAMQRRRRKLRNAPVDSRWIQWTRAVRDKMRRNVVATESVGTDAESLGTTVSGIYVPPSSDGRGGKACIEPAEQHRILENYIQLQILAKTINDVNLGRFPVPRKDNIEPRVLENAIANIGIINPGVTGNGEDHIGDAVIVSSDSSIVDDISSNDVDLINSHSSNSFSIRTEVGSGGTGLYTIPEGTFESRGRYEI